jgi:hypothetical protein
VVALSGILTVVEQTVTAAQVVVVKALTLLVEQLQERLILAAVVEQHKVVDLELLLFLTHLHKDF